MRAWSAWRSRLTAVGFVWGEAAQLARMFVGCIGIAAAAVAIACGAALWQAHMEPAPNEAMSRMMASAKPDVLIDMMALEASMLEQEHSSFSPGRIGRYLAERLLHIDPDEPKTLLAGALPGFRSSDAGEGDGGLALPPEAESGPEPLPLPEQEEVEPIPVGGAIGGEDGSEPVDAPPATDRKVVFIYHSHPRESWMPELGVNKPSEAEHESTNVTLIGKRLAERLEEGGVGAVHSGTDYPTTVPSYNWNFSYKYSLDTVREAFARHEDIRFLFDIHRDSANRDITTATIDGRDYAKVLFVVGRKNANWEQNEAFAKRIHEILEQRYPGLSRGILDKGSGSGHAEYNQSVSPNSILIEFGGVYNTLEESYRTADVLAEAIEELVWEAEKVDAPVTASAKK